MNQLTQEDFERLEPPTRDLSWSVRFLTVGWDGYISVGAFMLLVLGGVVGFHFSKTFSFKDYTAFHSDVVEVNGEVVKVVGDWVSVEGSSSSSSSETKGWNVDFEYEWEGEIKTGTSYTRTSGEVPPPPFEEGEKVRIEVLPQTPDEARIKGMSFGKNTGSRLLIILGVFVLSGLCFSASRKSLRKRVLLLRDGLVSSAFLSQDQTWVNDSPLIDGLEVNPQLKDQVRKFEFKDHKGRTQEASDVIACQETLRTIEAGEGLPILYLPFRPEAHFLPTLEDDFPLRIDGQGQWTPKTSTVVLKSAFVWFLLGAVWVFAGYRIF